LLGEQQTENLPTLRVRGWFSLSQRLEVLFACCSPSREKSFLLRASSFANFAPLRLDLFF
jgi:hypothetical protein